ncbi:MAG: hypothetical protein JRJ87_09325 [Deltaproteobacteria bacterium]|nr:hypothetical protein [Deltaproteobacteria bacterium]
MANRLAASSMTVVVLFFAIFVASGGCHKQAAEDLAGQKCFSGFERPAPGKLNLSQPVSCSSASLKYRLEGTIERPDLVVLLDEDGQIRASYRIEYGQNDRPRFEERILRVEPPSVKVFSQGDRMEFVRPIRKKWQTIRIMSELDAAGRVVKIVKYSGAERTFSLVKEYAGDNLKTEAAFDKDGKLKYRSTFTKKGSKTIERMVDGSGKILLERELGQDKQGTTEILDTSGHSPVQVGNSRSSINMQVNAPANEEITNRRVTK